MRYVTISCARAGKTCNQTSNVSRPRSTSKIDCNAKINNKYIDEVFKVLIVDNTHNHDLSSKKSRLFPYNREVNESVKNQLNTNNQIDILMNKNFTTIIKGWWV